ncbi:MAG TPA: YoaK family protein [Solirubrobacteraceae bacterium]|nr:YoaK family protein [Solirubrobacteraceae bacterium]
MTLGVAAGATDATSFEGLGHVFAGVVTGNLVLLGIGGVRRDGALALLAGCAIVGYAVGVLVASPRGCQNKFGDHRVWPVGVTVALASAAVLLLGFAVAWEATGGHPGHGVQAMLVPLLAVVMGIQTTAVRRLGPFSTTYLTGTLTALLEALVAGGWSSEESRGVAIILATIAGAAAATLVMDRSPASLPLVPLVPLTIVAITSGWLIEAELSGPSSLHEKMRKS